MGFLFLALGDLLRLRYLELDHFVVVPAERTIRFCDCEQAVKSEDLKHTLLATQSAAECQWQDKVPVGFKLEDAAVGVQHADALQMLLIHRFVPVVLQVRILERAVRRQRRIPIIHLPLFQHEIAES